MDERTKRNLLASLKALEINNEDSFEKPYEPSFGSPPTKSRNSGGLVDSNPTIFTFQPTEDNPFSNFKSLDQSSSAQSVRSTASVDSDKKAKLMKELFNYDAAVW